MSNCINNDIIDCNNYGLIMVLCRNLFMYGVFLDFYLILRCVAPRDKANDFAYKCILSLQTSYINGMLDHGGGGGGGGCQNAQKQTMMLTQC